MSGWALGNGFTGLWNAILEIHSEEQMRKQLKYLDDWQRYSWMSLYRFQDSVASIFPITAWKWLGCIKQNLFLLQHIRYHSWAYQVFGFCFSCVSVVYLAFVKEFVFMAWFSLWQTWIAVWMWIHSTHTRISGCYHHLMSEEALKFMGVVQSKLFAWQAACSNIPPSCEAVLLSSNNGRGQSSLKATIFRSVLD